MKWRTLYIIPNDLLSADVDIAREDTPVGRTGWGKTPIPGDPTKALLDVNWDDNPNMQAQFESLPGVLPLGHPWEPLPAEAVPLLASFQYFNAAYAAAYALDPATAQAAAYAAAKTLSPLTTTIAGPEVAPGDSVARGVHLATGRRFWG